MYKKIISVILALVIIMLSVSVLASETYNGYPIFIDVAVNGSFIKCSQKAFIENGVTYIPLRAFCNAVGAELSWNNKDKVATVTKGTHTFVFYNQKNHSLIDGKKDSAAIVKNNLLFIPVRATCQALGYNVEWSKNYYTVKITAADVKVPEKYKDYSYSSEDIIFLAKITHIESGSQPFKTKIAVANTVVNRKKSNQFPNSIKGVIFDTKYGTQFPPAHTSKINVTPSTDSLLAAKCALNGVNVAGNSLYFISTKSAASSWAHRNRPYYATIGSMNFYL